MERVVIQAGSKQKHDGKKKGYRGETSPKAVEKIPWGSSFNTADRSGSDGAEELGGFREEEKTSSLGPKTIDVKPEKEMG